MCYWAQEGEDLDVFGEGGGSCGGDLGDKGNGNGDAERDEEIGGRFIRVTQNPSKETH